MLDRLTSMRVFLSVVRNGSFAQAAAELGMSRAMASKHVQALEERLGVRLFNRSTRITRLTEAGQRYQEQLGDVLAQLDLVESRLSEDTAGVRGLLSIAAPPLFGALYLAPVIAAFMAEYPEIRLRLTLTDREIDLVDEGIDVAISVRELTDSSNIARRLTAVRMTVCASPAYLATHGRPQRPEDLAGHNCLLFAEQPLRHGAEWRFARAGEPLSIRVQGDLVSNAGDALRNLARCDRGIVRLPHYIVSDDLAAGRLQAILSDFEPPLRPVHALYAHRVHQPGKLRAFLDFAGKALVTE
jgi:DNA-binding transcriptional LysR family regulator